MAGGNRVTDAFGGMLSRVDTSKPQIGVVKDNIDSETMGRLKVWIKGSSTLEEDPKGWITCSYASPFAGASDPAALSKSLESYEGTQQSYGIWAVPPDLHNEVIVIFINGDMKKAYWTACIYQKDMNHMVPGIAEAASFQGNEFNNNALPVSEYNKLSNTANVRPYFKPLADGLQQQGLLGDSLRGAGSSSARRGSPSNVCGWLTPGGNQFIMDDGPDTELIRLRTKSGAQILISETDGHVYINSKDGNSWFELNNDGHIDCYAGAGFSVHTPANINFNAGGNINMNAGGNINVNAVGNVGIEAASNITAKATKSVSAQSGSNMNLKSAAGIAIAATEGLSQSSGGNSSSSCGGESITIQHGNVTTWRQSGTVNKSNTVTGISGVVSEPVPTTTSPTPVTPLPEAQHSIHNDLRKETPVTSVCDRIPDHEPWAGHGHTRTRVIEVEDTPTVKASTGSVTSNANKPLPLVGTPSKGMKAGVYSPKGYDKSNNPIYEYAGATTELKPVNDLVTSPEGIQFIAHLEGHKLTKYPDGNGYSIGYGHLIKASDSAEVRSGVISNETALSLFKEDLKSREAIIRKIVTVPLTQPQFDALMSFTYNTTDPKSVPKAGSGGGIYKLVRLSKLNEGNYANVPSTMAQFVTGRLGADKPKMVLPILIKRRREEGLLFATTAKTS